MDLVASSLPKPFPIKRFSFFFFPALILGLAVLSIFFGISVFLAPSAAALPSQLHAQCFDRAGAFQKVSVMPLDSGRFRIGVPDFSSKKLVLTLSPNAGAKFFMIRKGYDAFDPRGIGNLRVSIKNGPSSLIQGLPRSYTKRSFIPMTNSQEIVVEVESLESGSANLVLDEVGLFQKLPTIGKDRKISIIAVVCTLGLIAAIGMFAFLIASKNTVAVWGSIYVFVLATAIHFGFLFLYFSPEWARDLRINFASGTLQEGAGCNLNYGLYMASSVLQGKGPLICGMPPWCRMPGYGLLLALAGHGSDLLEMAMNAVILQVVFFAASLSFFFWTALRIMKPFAAGLAATIIAFLPAKMFYLQIESIMPSIVLLFLATAALFIEKYYKKERIALKYHLFLHASLALWFSIRTDILPAWALLSIFLYGKDWRSWKYFFIPLGFSLSIGLSWALFKMPFTGEFSMTTNSIGASFMGGLWEIPHKFIWGPTDESYCSWMESNHQNPATKAGSDFAVKEVLFFLAAYPMYFFTLAYHKFLLFAKNFSDIRVFTLLTWSRPWFLLIIFSSFVLKYKRFQTALLSWILLFNVPVFFIFYSSCGRFYEAPNICFFAATIPLLFDREFYKKVSLHKYKVAVMALVVLGIIQFGHSIDEAFIRADRFRYWTPFFDPAASTLNVEKQNG